MARCPVCGVPEGQCQDEYLMGLVTSNVAEEDKVSPDPEYFSNERVYGPDPTTGGQMVLYAVGDPIPEDEARRQGQIGGKAQKDPPADKAVREPPADKAVRAPGTSKSRRSRR